MQDDRNPFTVIPAVDRYNGKPLKGFRIDGWCSHLAPGTADGLYASKADAQAWVDFHVAAYHPASLNVCETCGVRYGRAGEHVTHRAPNHRYRTLVAQDTGRRTQVHHEPSFDRKA